ILEVIGPTALRTRFEAAARRGLVKFVGREPEMQILERALDRALHGQGQVVAVAADAGVGKSRLFFEFRRGIDPQCLLLESFSVSHATASAYLPLVEFLQGFLRICAEDDDAARRDKIRQAIRELGEGLTATGAALEAALGAPRRRD